MSQSGNCTCGGIFGQSGCPVHSSGYIGTWTVPTTTTYVASQINLSDESIKKLADAIAEALAKKLF